MLQGCIAKALESAVKYVIEEMEVTLAEFIGRVAVRENSGDVWDRVASWLGRQRRTEAQGGSLV
jgi:hypothetical protein